MGQRSVTELVVAGIDTVAGAGVEAVAVAVVVVVAGVIAGVIAGEALLVVERMRLGWGEQY